MPNRLWALTIPYSQLAQPQGYIRQCLQILQIAVEEPRISTWGPVLIDSLSHHKITPQQAHIHRWTMAMIDIRRQQLDREPTAVPFHNIAGITYHGIPQQITPTPFQPPTRPVPRPTQASTLKPLILVAQACKQNKTLATTLINTLHQKDSTHSHL